MSEKKLTLEQWIADLNSDPNPDHVKQNDDGSKYIPITISQILADETFLGMWDYEMVREVYGKSFSRGYGRMVATCPVNGKTIVRGGDAAMALTGDLRMDSPKLEAMVFLSCVRKFGKKFGRDLNREKQDAPSPVIQVKENLSEMDTIFEKEKEKVNAMNREEAECYVSSKIGLKFNDEIKAIINSKK